MRSMSYRSSKVMGVCIPSCPNSSHSRRAGGRAFSILIRGGIHICEVLERADGKMQPLFDGPSDVKATNVGGLTQQSLSRTRHERDRPSAHRGMDAATVTASTWCVPVS